MIRAVLLGSFLVVAALSLPSCIAVGNGTKNEPTTGQQLIDLKAALDRGIINQAEYDQQKAHILSPK